MGEWWGFLESWDLAWLEREGKIGGLDVSVMRSAVFGKDEAGEHVANLGLSEVVGDLAYKFDATANVERSYREVHWKKNSLNGRSERDRVSLTLDHEDQFSRTCMIFGVMSAFCRLDVP